MTINNENGKKKCWKFGMDNCYVFHMGLIKLGLGCILPFFNPAIKQTNNNKENAETATSVLYIYCGRLHSK